MFCDSERTNASVAAHSNVLKHVFQTLDDDRFARKARKLSLNPTVWTRLRPFAIFASITASVFCLMMMPIQIGSRINRQAEIWARPLLISSALFAALSCILIYRAKREYDDRSPLLLLIHSLTVVIAGVAGEIAIIILIGLIRYEPHR
jgi:hypothetical protein